MMTISLFGINYFKIYSPGFHILLIVEITELAIGTKAVPLAHPDLVETLLEEMQTELV